MSRFGVSMVDVESQLMREVGDPRMKRNDVALTYAFAIRQAQQFGESIDYAAVNRAIMDRWSMFGLRYIKERAWKLVEGKVQP